MAGFMCIQVYIVPRSPELVCTGVLQTCMRLKNREAIVKLFTTFCVTEAGLFFVVHAQTLWGSRIM